MLAFMPIDYDATVLASFADRLNSRATITVLGWTLIGIGIGAAAFGAFTVSRMLSPGVALAVAAVATAIGYAVGTERALLLRVQAQTILCQVAIESGIRRIASTIPDRAGTRVDA